MKDNYYIISRDGQIQGVAAYLAAGAGSESFRLFVRREALRDNVSRGAEGKPAYLSVAHNLGFDWEPNADLGIARYDYRAGLMRRLVEGYARSLVHNIGMPVYEVNGSNLFNLRHPIVEAYAHLYGDRLYRIPSGDHELVMSYDASYPQFGLAAAHPQSVKNLPYAHFSIADCYRAELSGECMLLYRQRRFYMPDLHPYFSDVDQAFAYLPALQNQILASGRELRRDYHVVIEVASQAFWKRYADQIRGVARELDRDVLVAVLNDAQPRYWILNIDYKIMDSLGQAREIACIQIDVANAHRLGIKLIDAQGKIGHPVIIHSAIPGGIERYLYAALDDFPHHLPLWLYPIGIRLIPVSDNYVDLCLKLSAKLRNNPVRLEIDDRNLMVAKKIRSAHESVIPYAVVIGEREANGAVPALDQAVEAIVASASGKPYIPREWPLLVSQQIR